MPKKNGNEFYWKTDFWEPKTKLRTKNRRVKIIFKQTKI